MGEGNRFGIAANWVKVLHLLKVAGAIRRKLYWKGGSGG